jgi:heat shock protein HslJ
VPLVLSGTVLASRHPLLGTNWVVVKVQGVAVPSGLTLSFQDERVTGSTGCNTFWAPVDYPDAPGIDVGAPQSKRFYCVGAMGIERAYFASLETVESFALKGDTLKMMMHDGDVFLELKAAPAQK